MKQNRKEKTVYVTKSDELSAYDTAEIMCHCKRNLTKELVILNAQKNGEHPFGYILDYIKDVFQLSKIEAYPIAEQVMLALSLTNSEC